VTSIREKKKVSISRRHEIRFLALLTAGLCVPVLGTFIAIFSTVEPDISDLTPISEKIGEDLILNWPDLERHPRALHEASSAFAGARVQALGYMMENDRPIRAGEPVQDFILLPGAGNLLHPAHRFGDQMIGVHLSPGNPVQFMPRRLVWVGGTFRAASGDPTGSRPLYDLEQAQVALASKTEIRRYFR
jgi:hypothetical protein